MENKEMEKYLKYIPYVLGLLVFFKIYNMIFGSSKDDKKEDDKKEVYNPNIVNQTDEQALALKKAQELVIALNTSKQQSGWNPFNWVEDEDKAIAILNGAGKYIVQLTKYYNELSRSGSLYEDLELLGDRRNEVVTI